MDVISLQKWLLAVESKADGKASDLNEDGVVDVYDLGLLKRLILSKK